HQEEDEDGRRGARERSPGAASGRARQANHRRQTWGPSASARVRGSERQSATSRRTDGAVTSKRGGAPRTARTSIGCASVCAPQPSLNDSALEPRSERPKSSVCSPARQARAMISQYSKLFGLRWNEEGREAANGTVATPPNRITSAPE